MVALYYYCYYYHHHGGNLLCNQKPLMLLTSEICRSCSIFLEFPELLPLAAVSVVVQNGLNNKLENPLLCGLTSSQAIQDLIEQGCVFKLLIQRMLLSLFRCL